MSEPHAASLPPGTAVLSNFFDDYPRFFETSKTSPSRDRLNLRYEAIFGLNREIFDGARVLDIASHDGRWSFAALKSGAAEVVGIEGRPELVTNAEETFEHYGIESDRYRFVAGDIFEVVARESMKFDVVMCLGFLYHTLRYNELMFAIRQMQPRHLIIDTDVILRDGPLVRVRAEQVAREGNAVADRYSHGERVFSGVPSVAAVRELLIAYDFEMEGLADWAGLLRDNPAVSQKAIGSYAAGKRVTIRARSVSDGP